MSVFVIPIHELVSIAKERLMLESEHNMHGCRHMHVHVHAHMIVLCAMYMCMCMCMCTCACACACAHDVCSTCMCTLCVRVCVCVCMCGMSNCKCTLICVAHSMPCTSNLAMLVIAMSNADGPPPPSSDLSQKKQHSYSAQASDETQCAEGASNAWTMHLHFVNCCIKLLWSCPWDLYC